MKSNVEGLEFQSKGVLVNLNKDGFKNYKKQKEIFEFKDKEVDDLKMRILMLETNFNAILSKFKGNE